MGSRAKDMVGYVFGRLTVISRTENNARQDAMWVCECSCGNTVTVSGKALRSGTKSCGCLQIEAASRQGGYNKTHGLAGSRFYKIWKGIKERCHNPNNSAFKCYGFLGIFVCGEWKDSFENFKSDMLSGYTDTLTLERTDVNKGYNKDNCKWIPREAQARNKGLQRNNTSGTCGVLLRKDKYWVASWYGLDGKQRVKLYSIPKHGDELARFLAEEKRDVEIRRLNLLGAGYSLNHGKPKQTYKEAA